MEATINTNDVKKELYKSKVNATFNRYEKGKLYYRVQLESGLYQFPIPVTEAEFITNLDGGDDIEYCKLSEDIGDTPFDNEIKASLLNRYISKAIDSGNFMFLI